MLSFPQVPESGEPLADRSRCREDPVRIVAAQPELRDRVALKLRFLMGLRKGELAAIHYRDFDLGRRRLRVHGKGGKIRHTPIPTEELRQEIAELSLLRDAIEHLLYPQKRGPKGTHGKKMHGARYTSGTEFCLATGDILRHPAAARSRRRQHDREHLRPRLARRPRGEAPESLGRIAAEAIPIDAVSTESFRSKKRPKRGKVGGTCQCANQAVIAARALDLARAAFCSAKCATVDACQQYRLFRFASAETDSVRWTRSLDGEV